MTVEDKAVTNIFTKLGIAVVPKEADKDMTHAMLIEHWNDPDHEASSVGHAWVRENMYEEAVSARPASCLETETAISALVEAAIMWRNYSPKTHSSACNMSTGKDYGELCNCSVGGLLAALAKIEALTEGKVT